VSVTVTERLLEELRFHEAHPVFVTGAGISIASGIPPFRGTADAVWERDVLEKGTYRFFLKHPDQLWSWYLSRFDKCRGAEPNPAHHAIVAIESWFKAKNRPFDLITQNVDGLHIKAGSNHVTECHGAARYMRCTNCCCKHGPPKGLIEWDESLLAEFRENPCLETVPRCPACAEYLRAHVLWFDESYSGHYAYGIDHIEQLMDQMTVLLFVGTSFAVTITDLMMTAAYQSAVPIFNIDPHAEEMDGMIGIRAKAEEFLPELASALTI
jgi:NAD-dependent deacetylase